MTRTNITTAFWLDQRRAKADGTFPIKLRVIHQRQNRLFGTLLSATREDFDCAIGPKPRAKYKDLVRQMHLIQQRAISLISSIDKFSLDTFAEKWYEKRSNDPKEVFSAYLRVIDDMERQSRVGNAIAYRCAMKSMQKYHGKDKLQFDHINVQFLKEYEAVMLGAGNSLTTVGIYLRCLRSLYKTAIANGAASPEKYPFGSVKNGKYAIPEPRNIKKALPKSELKKIFDYSPLNETEAMYRDLWLFSYLCNGANMKDICLLKWCDLSGDRITFRRSKTANTNRGSKPIIVAYTDELKAIVGRWGQRQRSNTNFVFPYLTQGDTEKQIKNKVAGVVKLVNKYIKRIAAALSIQGNITTYTARHSFASALRNEGVNVSFISESMGHSDIKTTEAYLSSIDDKQRGEFAKLLTKFS